MNKWWKHINFKSCQRIWSGQCFDRKSSLRRSTIFLSCRLDSILLDIFTLTLLTRVWVTSESKSTDYISVSLKIPTVGWDRYKRYKDFNSVWNEVWKTDFGPIISCANNHCMVMHDKHNQFNLIYRMNQRFHQELFTIFWISMSLQPFGLLHMRLQICP